MIPKSSSSGSQSDSLTRERTSKDFSTSNTGRSTASFHVASKDYTDSSVVKLRSSSVKTANEAPKSASSTTAAFVPKTGLSSSGSWKSGNEDHRLEKVESTPIVKSSMTIKLNTGGVGSAQEKGVESVSRTTSGFSAVLEEIQSRKVASIAVESQRKIVGSSANTQPSQGLHPLQGPSPHAALQPREPLQPYQAPHIPAVSLPQQSPPPRMSENDTGDENLDEDVHRRVKLMNWNPVSHGHSVANDL